MHRISPYLPLSPLITVGKSKIHGLGIIATNNIEAGIDLGISHVLDNDYEDGLIRTALGGFVNHSDTPNCTYRKDGKNLRLVTVRTIKEGEEITVSYRGWYADSILDTFK